MYIYFLKSLLIWKTIYFYLQLNPVKAELLLDPVEKRQLAFVWKSVYLFLWLALNNYVANNTNNF